MNNNFLKSSNRNNQAVKSVNTLKLNRILLIYDIIEIILNLILRLYCRTNYSINYNLYLKTS